MRIDDLRNFIEICRCGSINKAAVCLNISQQGLSRTVKALEDQVGARLFQRSPKGVALTSYGQGFFRMAEAVVNAADDLDEYVEKNRPDEMSRLRVGLRISLNSSPMSSAIYSTVEDFGIQRSDVKVVTHFASQDTLLDELISGDVDVAHLIGPVDEKRFNVFPVLKYKLCMIWSQDMGLGFADGEAVDIRKLQDIPIVAPSFDSPLCALINDYFRAGGIKPLIVKHEPSAKTSVHLVSRGEGTGFIPQNSAEIVCRMYPKIRMNPVEPETYFVYSLVTPKGRVPSGTMALIDYVMENAEKNIIPDAI